MLISFFKKPFVLLLTVPAVIALAIGLLPFVTVLLEKRFATGLLSPFSFAFAEESARTLLSVIATGAMSALSLAYSLVLVVFTLAAGNVGPRLLKRFTSELVNQVTAGILGGTFLYAIFTLMFTQGGVVPKLTIAGAALLAVICVLQLIYFVRCVSISVSIDDEVAHIAAGLQRLIKDYDACEWVQDIPEESRFNQEVVASHSGYVATIQHLKLVASAKQIDGKILMLVAHGDFVAKGQAILRYCSGKNEDSEHEELEKQLQQSIELELSRSEHGNINFSVKLLIEVALRALSPGVNDTFTALTVCDHLSDAFTKLWARKSRHTLYRDDDQQERLIMVQNSTQDLMDQAFHPLRLGARNNVLMAQGLARAYARLVANNGEAMVELMQPHAKLLICQLQQDQTFDEDIERVRSLLPKALQT